jgi:hypothetical protein
MTTWLMWPWQCVAQHSLEQLCALLRRTGEGLADPEDEAGTLAEARRFCMSAALQLVVHVAWTRGIEISGPRNRLCVSVILQALAVVIKIFHSSTCRLAAVAAAAILLDSNKKHYVET